jgi:hypothetical protein
VKSYLDPLPDTLADWAVAGYPDVFVEVRDEPDGTIIGTMEQVWPGPEMAAPMIRVREFIAWEQLKSGGPTIIAEAIAQATKARRRSIRPCAQCRERTAPESGMRIDGRFVCYGCASTHHGVVF